MYTKGNFFNYHTKTMMQDNSQGQCCGGGVKVQVRLRLAESLLQSCPPSCWPSPACWAAGKAMYRQCWSHAPLLTPPRHWRKLKKGGARRGGAKVKNNGAVENFRVHTDGEGWKLSHFDRSFFCHNEMPTKIQRPGLLLVYPFTPHIS